jgi:hypothetical protein
VLAGATGGLTALQQANVLSQQVGADQGNIFAVPAAIFAEFGAQARPLVEIAVAPKVHDLVERSISVSNSPSSLP